MTDWRALSAISLTCSLLSAQGVDCSFRNDPTSYEESERRAWQDTNHRLKSLRRTTAISAEVTTAAAGEIPRRNFIDSAIFDRAEQAAIPVSRLSDDYEFVRRIHLDLTGRLPEPDAIREFVASGDENKRAALIDRLLQTHEFSEKWMLWLGDLFESAAFSSTQNIQINGRNAFYAWLKKSMDERKSLRDLVWEAMVAKGNNYSPENGAASWHVRSRTGGGPIQDTYDTAFSRAASQFLGVAHYDCILCHNGRGHLETLTLWGGSASRTEAQRMAAFFSRIRYQGARVERTDPLYQSFDVADATTGAYNLNTNFGNRPNRQAIGAVNSLTPVYRDGRTPSSSDWRGEFAGFLVTDPQFAINLSNRIWKQVFNLGLIEPVDQMDLARLDPNANLPEGWSLQATHPALLLRLAEELGGLNFDLREFVRLLVSSSAYQLSSHYDGEWKLEYVPLFVRHYPRRLEGEEVHDAIQKATGVLGNYTVNGWTEPVRWALQLPEPVEPRTNGAVAGFMNTFLRGNRDTQFRTQQGSILQQLGLMNDNFVLQRIRTGNSATVRALGNAADIPAGIEQLYLGFLSRKPDAAELARAIDYIQARGPGQRMRSAEDLAWTLVNRTEFVFSY